jgi:glycosyltransferase involved in cell wall biosynthesis
MIITASLIIPTHNRSASLKMMLNSLELQSYALQSFEVMVVADGCRDNTVEMVKNYQPGFHLTLCELPGLGAASARNEGASKARGQILIFADDDMELSKDFIKEHIALHTNQKTVVVGYSPFKLESRATIQRLTLREWWEEKFQEMRKKDHRFKYDNLTSGNFSVSSQLFNELKGFNTSLLCREDYELGYRLIKAGAEFRFAYAAKAFHCDEVTNLHRSLQRKKSEGMADIQIKTLHPDFINKEAIYYLSQRSISKSVLVKGIQFFPFLMDRVAGFAETIMNYFERMRLLSSWSTTNYRLHQYWYLRGLLQGAGSYKQLYQYVMQHNLSLNEKQKLTIDLEKGLKKAEEEIDGLKPLAIDIYYGNKFIGKLDYEPGEEPIKGYHLRKILKDRFSPELAVVLFPTEIFKKKN